MDKNITLPDWLDSLIFNKYGARYERHPEEVQYNPDKDSEFVKDYLGTYFPRSFAEGRCIVGQLLDNPRFFASLSDLEEIRLLDFCCGTGGEFFGIISILLDRLPSLRHIRIDAFDANVHAVRLLFKLSSDISNLYSERAEIRVNPQCININGDLNLTDIDNHIRDTRYHFIVSFKALNELIQRDTFPDENVYRKIAAHFLPFLEPNGTLVISDLTHKAPDGIYYPKRINAGFISLVRATFEFKSIFPHPCYFHEKQCSGCYMQDRITVSHSGVDSPDPTKVVYRALCRADFADAIMQGIKPCPCRFTEGFSADKALPYLNSNL